MEPSATAVTPHELQNSKDIGHLDSRVSRIEEAITQIRSDTLEIKATVQQMHEHNEQVCTLARVATFFLKFVVIPGVPLTGVIVTYLLAKGHI